MGGSEVLGGGASNEHRCRPAPAPAAERLACKRGSQGYDLQLVSSPAHRQQVAERVRPARGEADIALRRYGQGLRAHHTSSRAVQRAMYLPPQLQVSEVNIIYIVGHHIGANRSGIRTFNIPLRGCNANQGAWPRDGSASYLKNSRLHHSETSKLRACEISKPAACGAAGCNQDASPTSFTPSSSMTEAPFRCFESAAGAGRSSGRQSRRLSCPRRSDFSTAARMISGLSININGLRSETCSGILRLHEAGKSTSGGTLRCGAAAVESAPRQTPCRMNSDTLGGSPDIHVRDQRDTRSSFDAKDSRPCWRAKSAAASPALLVRRGSAPRASNSSAESHAP